MTSMDLGTVNTKFYYFILYFILFKERLLEKHRCIVVFVKLKTFQQEDNKEQDISTIDSSAAKKHFFCQYWSCWFLCLLGLFLYICLFQCREYEYLSLSYSMNFLFNISFLFSGWVFPFSNCWEIKGYLAHCSLFKESSPSEHSHNILRKFKQITRYLLLVATPLFQGWQATRICHIFT